MIQILLATWNSAAFLEEQLHSLFAQTYQDFEILIHDGGSRDKTIQIIHSYEARYQGRIRYLGSHPCDACANFSYLLSCAEGELLMFCDHDDVWKPHKIQRSLEAFQKAETQYGSKMPLLVFTDLEVVDQDMRTLYPSMMRSQKLNRRRFTPERLIMQNAVTGNTMLFNKALRDLVLPIPSEALMHDHYAALAAAFFGKIIYLDEPLILYRQHGKNVIGSFRFCFSALLKKLLTSRGKLRYDLYRKIHQTVLLLNAHRNRLGEKDLAFLEKLQQFPAMGFFQKRIFLWRSKLHLEGLIRNLGLYLIV